MIKAKFRSGFTIVELIVVIAVIGILAGIVILSFGAWRTEVATSSLKSDLTHAASAMESYRNFDAHGYYPTTGIPSTFSASANNVVTLFTPASTSAFCINGTSGSIQYYIDNLTQTNGPTAGTCIGRTNLPAPASVSNVSFSSGSTQIVVNWTPGDANALQYEVQCALDQAFVTGLIDDTAYGTSTSQDTLSGANPTTTYFCRVRAQNNNGQSDWVGSGAGNTHQLSCADTSQYGTYPNCYNYDSLPVGTSIAGYWSTAPDGYLLENGAAVSRTTYSDLFAAIGTTYGAGDGSTTFNLPDSRGRVDVNISSSDAEFNTVGEKYGEKTHVLTIPEIPAHNHSFTYGGNKYASWQYTGSPNLSGQIAFSVATTVYSTIGISTTGASAPSNVIQPSIVKVDAIKYRVATGTDSTLSVATSIDGYWSSAPTGYLLENGAAVSRTTYSDLFAAIGTTYGAGDGSTTFNLPDSRGRVGVNKSPTDAEFNTMGEKYGEKAHTLTYAEMPSHTHGFTYGGGTYASFPYTGAPNTSGGLAFSVGTVLYGGGIGISSTGGGGAHNIIQPSIVKTAAIKYTVAAGTVDASSTGTSISGYWTSAPTGYLAEDGSTVSRSTYSDLFAILGTTYGAGNGSTTFNLPDSRGRVSVNQNPSDAEFATIGEKYGEKTHTLTVAELAAHSHSFTYSGSNYGSWPYTGSPNTSGGLAFSVGLTVYGAIGISSEGNGQPYNVIQPSIVKMYAIKY